MVGNECPDQNGKAKKPNPEPMPELIHTEHRRGMTSEGSWQAETEPNCDQAFRSRRRVVNSRRGVGGGHRELIGENARKGDPKLSDPALARLCL